MKFQTIDQRVQINAPAQKVWQVMWDKNHYKTWAAAFTPGSHYVGDLKTGGHIQFLDPNQNGMESRVDSINENKEITFLHQNELMAGKEGRSLGNMSESYTLDEQDGITTLNVKVEMPEEYCTEMEVATKKAFQLLKELVESER